MGPPAVELWNSPIITFRAAGLLHGVGPPLRRPISLGLVWHRFRWLPPSGVSGQGEPQEFGFDAAGCFFSAAASLPDRVCVGLSAPATGKKSNNWFARTQRARLAAGTASTTRTLRGFPE